MIQLFSNRNSHLYITAITLFFSCLLPVSAATSSKPELQSIWTATPPQLDGKNNDVAWSSAPVFTAHDKVANIDIQLQSVHTRNKIYMLVRYPDTTENRQHKMMHWDEARQRYSTGKEREDTFIFKWNLFPVDADLTLSSDTPYKADIWYWKSMRTDHAGYADDKIQSYQLTKVKSSRLLISKNGSFFYLSRKGDQGRAAYKPAFYTEKAEDTMNKYEFINPTGSRADIKAKGYWKEGVWTIEFERALDTGHADDVQFNLTSNYFFGISRHEIAGRKPDSNIEQSNFGSGDINQLIKLRFIN